MKNLIHTYLNFAYPNVFIKKTKFGNLLCGYNKNDSGWPDVRLKLVETIMKMFSCNFITADDALNEWCAKRPKYESIYNTNNELILVRVSDIKENQTT